VVFKLCGKGQGSIISSLIVSDSCTPIWTLVVMQAFLLMEFWYISRSMSGFFYIMCLLITFVVFVMICSY